MINEQINEDTYEENEDLNEDNLDDDEDVVISHLVDDDDDDDDFVIIKEIVNNTENPPKEEKRKPGPKPKLIGKHSLSYDTIFKGKKNKAVDEDDLECEHIIKNAGGSLDIQESFLDSEESKSNIDYYRESTLKIEIRKILEEFTDIDFNSPRRKPAKSDFNSYFAILIKDLHAYGYTKTEIFIELSGYFTDNYWNMFQLLESRFSNAIIQELKQKYGLSDIDKINFV